MPMLYFKATFFFQRVCNATIALKREVRLDFMPYFIVFTSKDPLGEIINQSHILASRVNVFHAYIPRMIILLYFLTLYIKRIFYIKKKKRKIEFTIKNNYQKDALNIICFNANRIRNSIIMKILE